MKPIALADKRYCRGKGRHFVFCQGDIVFTPLSSGATYSALGALAQGGEMGFEFQAHHPRFLPLPIPCYLPALFL